MCDPLLALFASLDPVRLLQQLHTLQEALRRHAVVPNAADTAGAALAGVRPPGQEVAFNVHGCGLPITPEGAFATSPSIADLAAFLTGPAATKRKYRCVKTRVLRTWRTRPDPFATVWEEIRQWLEAVPERTAKELFAGVQRAYPGQYANGQLRTLQRRVKAWRAQAIVQFDQRWREDELLLTQVLPAALTAQTSHPGDRVSAMPG